MARRKKESREPKEKGASNPWGEFDQDIDETIGAQAEGGAETSPPPESDEKSESFGSGQEPEGAEGAGNLPEIEILDETDESDQWLSERAPEPESGTGGFGSGQTGSTGADSASPLPLPPERPPEREERSEERGSETGASIHGDLIDEEELERLMAEAEITAEDDVTIIKRDMGGLNRDAKENLLSAQSLTEGLVSLKRTMGNSFQWKKEYFFPSAFVDALDVFDATKIIADERQGMIERTRDIFSKNKGSGFQTSLELNALRKEISKKTEGIERARTVVEIDTEQILIRERSKELAGNFLEEEAGQIETWSQQAVLEIDEAIDLWREQAELAQGLKRVMEPESFQKEFDTWESLLRSTHEAIFYDNDESVDNAILELRRKYRQKLDEEIGTALKDKNLDETVGRIKEYVDSLKRENKEVEAQNEEIGEKLDKARVKELDKKRYGTLRTIIDSKGLEERFKISARKAQYQEAYADDKKGSIRKGRITANTTLLGAYWTGKVARMKIYKYEVTGRAGWNTGHLAIEAVRRLTTGRGLKRKVVDAMLGQVEDRVSQIRSGEKVDLREIVNNFKYRLNESGLGKGKLHTAEGIGKMIKDIEKYVEKIEKGALGEIDKIKEGYRQQAEKIFDDHLKWREVGKKAGRNALTATLFWTLPKVAAVKAFGSTVVHLAGADLMAKDALQRRKENKRNKELAKKQDFSIDESEELPVNEHDPIMEKAMGDKGWNFVWQRFKKGSGLMLLKRGNTEFDYAQERLAEILEKARKESDGNLTQESLKNFLTTENLAKVFSDRLTEHSQLLPDKRQMVGLDEQMRNLEGHAQLIRKKILSRDDCFAEGHLTEEGKKRILASFEAMGMTNQRSYKALKAQQIAHKAYETYVATMLAAGIFGGEGEGEGKAEVSESDVDKVVRFVFSGTASVEAATEGEGEATGEKETGPQKVGILESMKWENIKKSLHMQSEPLRNAYNYVLETIKEENTGEAIQEDVEEILGGPVEKASTYTGLASDKYRDFRAAVEEAGLPGVSSPLPDRYTEAGLSEALGRYADDPTEYEASVLREFNSLREYGYNNQIRDYLNSSDNNAFDDWNDLCVLERVLKAANHNDQFKSVVEKSLGDAKGLGTAELVALKELSELIKKGEPFYDPLLAEYKNELFELARRTGAMSARSELGFLNEAKESHPHLVDSAHPDFNPELNQAIRGLIINGKIASSEWTEGVSPDDFDVIHRGLADSDFKEVFSNAAKNGLTSIEAGDLVNLEKLLISRETDGGKIVYPYSQEIMEAAKGDLRGGFEIADFIIRIELQVPSDIMAMPEIQAELKAFITAGLAEPNGEAQGQIVKVLKTVERDEGSEKAQELRELREGLSGEGVDEPEPQAEADVEEAKLAQSYERAGLKSVYDGYPDSVSYDAREAMFRDYDDALNKWPQFETAITSFLTAHSAKDAETDRDNLVSLHNDLVRLKLISEEVFRLNESALAEHIAKGWKVDMEGTKQNFKEKAAELSRSEPDEPSSPQGEPAPPEARRWVDAALRGISEDHAGEPASDQEPLGEVKVTIENGDSVWRVVEKALLKYGDNLAERHELTKFDDLEVGRQDHVIDSIKDEVSENPAKFNLEGVTDYKEMSKAQLRAFMASDGFKEIFNNQDNKLGERFEAAEELTDAEVRRIEEYRNSDAWAREARAVEPESTEAQVLAQVRRVAPDLNEEQKRRVLEVYQVSQAEPNEEDRITIEDIDSPEVVEGMLYTNDLAWGFEDLDPDQEIYYTVEDFKEAEEPYENITVFEDSGLEDTTEFTFRVIAGDEGAVTIEVVNEAGNVLDSKEVAENSRVPINYEAAEMVATLVEAELSFRAAGEAIGVLGTKGIEADRAKDLLMSSVDGKPHPDMVEAALMASSVSNDGEAIERCLSFLYYTYFDPRTAGALAKVIITGSLDSNTARSLGVADLVGEDTKVEFDGKKLIIKNLEPKKPDGGSSILPDKPNLEIDPAKKTIKVNHQFGFHAWSGFKNLVSGEGFGRDKVFEGVNEGNLDVAITNIWLTFGGFEPSADSPEEAPRGGALDVEILAPDRPGDELQVGDILGKTLKVEAIDSETGIITGTYGLGGNRTEFLRPTGEKEMYEYYIVDTDEADRVDLQEIKFQGFVKIGEETSRPVGYGTLNYDLKQFFIEKLEKPGGLDRTNDPLWNRLNELDQMPLEDRDYSFYRDLKEALDEAEAEEAQELPKAA